MQMTSDPARGSEPRNYPMNCWWVAATSTEVSRQPLERWLLDRPVVMYRTTAGQPVALDNRCVHRWAPLSSGYLEGDQIVCAYHGARYETDGSCARYPTQAAVPSTARVRSYAVVERGPFIWIWMGDDARREQTALPPEFAWALDPSWTVVLDGFPLEANYMALHENVLDLTHFNHLHRDSFRITNRQPPQYRTEGDRVIFNLTQEAAEMDEPARQAAGMGDPFALRQNEEGAFVTPALHIVTSVTTRSPNPVMPEQAVTHVNHLVTPENDRKTHYWWLIGVHPAIPPEFAEGMKRTVEQGYTEDKVMLASIQRMIDRDPRGRDYSEFSFKGDTGGIQTRRVLERILAAD